MPKKYDDLPEYLELTKLLRRTWDYNTANKFLKLFAGWQDMLTADDDQSLLQSICVIEPDAIPDVVTSPLKVGFHIKNLKGDPSPLSMPVEYAVFDKADLNQPQFTASLASPIDGKIIGGEASAALKVETVDGKFSCMLTALPGQVHLSTKQTFNSPLLITTGIQSITFP